MDNSQNNEIDIRQSPQWAECLKLYGWKTFSTSSGVNVQIIGSKFAGMVKVQKPGNLTSTELNEIENIAKRNRAFLVLIEPSEHQDVSVLKDLGYFTSGFILTPARTLVIDLQKSKDELWDDLSHSAKYSINRAKREGARVEFFTNPSEEKLKEFYAIYRETGITKKYATKSWDDLKKRAETFKDDAHLVLVYDKSGRLDGGKFYLGYNGNVWYIYGGTSAAGRKNKTGYELFWQSILFLKEKGYKKLDTDGIYDPRFPSFLTEWGGFSHFKEKFGGQIVEFPMAQMKVFNKFLAGFFKKAAINL